MIAPLRRLHRATFVVLAVAVPVLFLGALARRPEAPRVAKLPAELAGTAAAGAQPLELFPGYASSLAVRAKGAQLKLEALEPLRWPGLLAYFCAEAPVDTHLPADAHLLGPVAWGQPGTFGLPAAAAGGGHLVLYSLPHQEVKAASRLPGFELPAPAAPPDEVAKDEEEERP